MEGTAVGAKSIIKLQKWNTAEQNITIADYTEICKQYNLDSSCSQESYTVHIDNVLHSYVVT